jgi:diacylglycerol kinase family enzyme
LSVVVAPEAIAGRAAVPRWCAVANPHAGSPGATERVARRLCEAGLVDTAVLTGSRASLRQALQAHAADDIVVVGGDGTVAAVLADIDRTRQRLAILPCGHGNCLARDLGVGTVDAALRALAQGRTRWIDLLEVRLTCAGGAPRTLLAASTVALGYVADVVRFGRAHLAPLGRHAYAAAALLTRPRRLALHVRADADDVLGVEPVTGVVINNTAQLANFRALPDARLDDGRLDLLLLDASWPRQVLHDLAAALGSAAFGGRLLRQARTCDVRLAAPAVLMVDGELIDDVVQVSVQCLPRSLCCIHAPR